METAVNSDVLAGSIRSGVREQKANGPNLLFRPCPTVHRDLRQNAIRFSEEQIIKVLKEHAAGLSAGDLSRQHGISDATFYKWR
jgi:hypothetical protein